MRRNLSLSSIVVVCILAVSAAAIANEGTAALQPAPEPEGGSGLVETLDLTEGPICESDELRPRAKESAAACKSGCNKKCAGASNKAKCVGTCRRACDG